MFHRCALYVFHRHAMFGAVIAQDARCACRVPIHATAPHVKHSTLQALVALLFVGCVVLFVVCAALVVLSVEFPILVPAGTDSKNWNFDFSYTEKAGLYVVSLFPYTKKARLCRACICLDSFAAACTAGIEKRPAGGRLFGLVGCAHYAHA